MQWGWRGWELRAKAGKDTGNMSPGHGGAAERDW